MIEAILRPDVRESKASEVYTEYSYDARGRVTTLAHWKSDASLISIESYGYNLADALVSKVVDGVTTSYGYDAVDQLLSETRTGYSASYTYDSNGNRTSRTLNGLVETYSVDSGDKLASVTWSGGSRSIAYDAAGRTTGITDGSGTRAFTYDFESRISRVDYPGGAYDTFGYNGFDTRVTKGGTSGSLTYRRDGAYVTDPVLSDGQSVYTPGISERRNGVSRFYHENYLGTIGRQTDGSQSTVSTRDYDAFGNLLGATGSTASPFGFAGSWGYQEDASGLKLLGHRQFSPDVGRFLTRDPLGDGLNGYAYLRNNPTNAIDPTGLLFERLIDLLLPPPKGPPPFPVPGAGPGNGWKWNPNPGGGRPGSWGPQKPLPGQSQPKASWEQGGQHWDSNDGLKNPRVRYNRWGRELTFDQAHDKGPARYLPPASYFKPSPGILQFLEGLLKFPFIFPKEPFRPYVQFEDSWS